jgi:predicted phosphodiesterase
MRVGLMADSHDRIPAIAEFVKIMQAGGVTMLLHAGDYIAPFALAPIEEASMSLSGVFGRNDGDTQGLLAKATAGFGAELFEGPHSFEAHSIVVHGFTHQQAMKTRGDTLIVNPGESCGWLFGTPKAAILDLDTKKVEFLSLDPSHWTT